MSEKYRELVALLEEVGIMQLDQPWALEIQKLLKQHKEAKPVCRQPQAHPARCGCED